MVDKHIIEIEEKILIKADLRLVEYLSGNNEGVLTEEEFKKKMEKIL